MKGKRYTTEQKIQILREAEQGGKMAVGVCRAHQISEQTFHRWKREFGMLEVDHAGQILDRPVDHATRHGSSDAGGFRPLVSRGDVLEHLLIE